MVCLNHDKINYFLLCLYLSLDKHSQKIHKINVDTKRQCFALYMKGQLF